MNVNLSVSLKIFALFFWWYVIVFLLSISPMLGFDLPTILSPEYRGDLYVWDFELMFTSIFVVWGYYLWMASRVPEKNELFISFTITATFAHIVAMLIIGLLRPTDLQHMIIDAVALSIPVILTLYSKRQSTLGKILENK